MHDKLPDLANSKQFSPFLQMLGGYIYIYIHTAVAKQLQSCPTLCDPIDGSPTRLTHPWDSPGKNTGVGCHFLFQGMKVKSESEVTQLCPTLSDPMDCSLPGSSVHGIFFRQEYWSGWPLLSPSTSPDLLVISGHCFHPKDVAGS